MKDFLKKIIIYLITFESKLIIKKYQPKIVAITGSVGKTGTKDAVHALFSKLFYAEKSPKSFNSEIGIPLSIIGGQKSGWRNPLSWLKVVLDGLFLIILPNHYPRWLILEVGADRPGDIEEISNWLKTDVAIFTRMSEVPVHVEFFDSPQSVLKEKMFLLKSLRSEQGVAVYNYDDEIIRREIEDRKELTKLSYGFDKKARVSASNYAIIYDRKTGFPSGINFKINFDGSSVPATIYDTVGRQQVYAVLAGVTAILSQGGNPVKAIEGLLDYRSQPGRMKILEGVKNSLIIDDSYNSSPVALFESLDTLKSIKCAGRKIVILGDMMEIGRYSIDEHKKAGALVAEFADFIFTVGVRAKCINDGALERGFSPEKIFNFGDSREAGKQVEIMVQPGDIVLVKGSQSARMERAVEEIMNDPMKKEELLVRQEQSWRF